MKKIFIVLFVFYITTSAFGKSSSFILMGEIESVQHGTVKLIYKTFENKKWVLNEIESTILNGKFKFKGYLTEPVESEITINDSIQIKLFIEPTIMNLYMLKEKHNKFKLAGSQTQIDYERLKTKLYKLDSLYEENSKTVRPLYEELNSLQEGDSIFGIVSQKIDFLNKQADTINLAKLHIMKNFMLNNPSSYYPILSNMILVSISQKYLNVDSARVIFNKLDKRVKTYSQSIFLDRYLSMKENTRIGKYAPIFTTKDVNGKQVSLTNFKGRYVLLDFWASWCFWCVKGIPHIKELKEKYNKELEIIGISCDRTNEDWIKSINKYQINDWIQVMSVQDTKKNIEGYVNDEDISQKYPTDGIPLYILIDKEGKIIKKWNGYSEENEKEMDEVMKGIFGY